MLDIDILRAASRLNPPELFPNASHEPMRNNWELVYARQPELKRQHFARTFRFLAFIRNFAKYSVDFRAGSAVSERSHLFFGFTVNQSSALRPIVSAFHETVPNEKAMLLDGRHTAFTKRRSYWWSLLFFPFLISRMRSAEGYQKESFKYAFEDYLLTYGSYTVVRKWLRRLRPKSVVVSNDHSRLPCVIVRAAQDEKIPTFYVQHACVTDRFPPLKVDFALLDGNDAKEKYVNAGEKFLAANDKRASIELIGITKLDGFQNHINSNPTVETVGVCLSLADDIDRVVGALRALAEIKNICVRVRPHMGMPLETRNKIRATCELLGFELSIHEKESPLDYLKSLDLLVCGVSSIALEGALLDVTVINFTMNSEHPDWYGFIENGLIKSVDDVDELIEFVKKQQIERKGNRHATKRYCGTVETSDEGRSSLLAARKIDELTRQKANL